MVPNVHGARLAPQEAQGGPVGQKAFARRLFERRGPAAAAERMKRPQPRPLRAGRSDRPSTPSQLAAGALFT